MVSAFVLNYDFLKVNKTTDTSLYPVHVLYWIKLTWYYSG